MLVYVQATGASSGWSGSAGRGGPAARDPVAHATDQEAESYDECNDALSGTGRDLAGAQGFD